MSARQPRLVVAPRAQRGVRRIRPYGPNQWGAAQADAAQAAPTKGFERLRDHPRIGKARDGLGVGLRAWPVRHHVLCYRTKDDAIEVVRILHERADPARHLRP